MNRPSVRPGFVARFQVFLRDFFFFGFRYVVAMENLLSNPKESDQAEIDRETEQAIEAIMQALEKKYPALTEKKPREAPAAHVLQNRTTKERRHRTRRSALRSLGKAYDRLWEKFQLETKQLRERIRYLEAQQKGLLK